MPRACGVSWVMACSVLLVLGSTSLAVAQGTSDASGLGPPAHEGVNSFPASGDAAGEFLISAGAVDFSRRPEARHAPWIDAGTGEAVPTGVPARRRLSASELLKGQEAARSFAALRPFLRPGDEVVVTDTGGRVRRGRVVSLDDAALVVARPVTAGTWEAVLPLWYLADVGVALKRSLSPSPDRVFTEPTVNTIDIVDPTGNGTAIGGAVGAGVAAGVYLVERRQAPSSLKGIGTFIALAWGIPISMRIGHVLDRAINQPIFTRQPRSRQVSLVPWLGRGVKGVVISVDLDRRFRE